MQLYHSVIISYDLQCRAIWEEKWYWVNLIPTVEEFERLHREIQDNQIEFYVAQDDDKLVAMCSVCKTFSTFNYQAGGVLEDFYIVPIHRHKGLAKKLVHYAFENSGISSLTVGCADCDVDMYKAIGFTVPLGNMMAYNA